jgi:hypothetical protein
MRTYTIIIIVDLKAKFVKIEYSKEGTLLITATSYDQGRQIGIIIESQMEAIAGTAEFMNPNRAKLVKTDKTLDKGT